MRRSGNRELERVTASSGIDDGDADRAVHDRVFQDVEWGAADRCVVVGRFRRRIDHNSREGLPGVSKMIDPRWRITRARRMNPSVRCSPAGPCLPRCKGQTTADRGGRAPRSAARVSTARRLHLRDTDGARRRAGRYRNEPRAADALANFTLTGVGTRDRGLDREGLKESEKDRDKDQTSGWGRLTETGRSDQKRPLDLVRRPK